MAMALPLPDLDDRRWDDLVEEGRSLIPFYAPEWTDHNAHDPGITLLELFAWLAEMELFELNQISDRQRRKLLALAGVMSKPASPAHALLRLEPAGAAPVSIEAGLEFSGLDPFGAEVRFRALHGLDALPGSISALQSADGHNHWVSDMVAGALIGTGIGNVILHNYEERRDGINMSFAPIASSKGAGIGFQMTF